MIQVVDGSWPDFFDSVRAKISEEQALVVERLRVERALTWRGVAEEFYDLYPDELFGVEMCDNQGAGMALVEAASARLGRSVD